MQKSDSGLSYVVGFTLLLMIFVMIIGTWAIVGVPEQIKDAESYHAVTVTNAFLDYKIAVDDLRLNNHTGVNVSMLIPAASSYSAGALSLADDIGTLTISNDHTLWEGKMTRLSATFGTRSTILGYEGGGVYRADYGYAAWVTPPMFELDNVNNDLYATVVLPELVGSFAVASTEGIPVDTGLDPSFVWSMYSTNQTVTISYTADDAWDAALWHTAFFEAVTAYENTGAVQNISCEPSISADGKTAYLVISPYPASGEYVHINVLPAEYYVDVGRA